MSMNFGGAGGAKLLRGIMFLEGFYVVFLTKPGADCRLMEGAYLLRGAIKFGRKVVRDCLFNYI